MGVMMVDTPPASKKSALPMRLSGAKPIVVNRRKLSGKQAPKVGVKKAAAAALEEQDDDSSDGKEEVEHDPYMTFSQDAPAGPPNE